MATLGDLRTALVDTLTDALPGWNVYRFPPDSISAPGVAVIGPDIAAASFGDASTKVTMDLLAVVSHRHVDQLEQLDELLSAGGDPSIWRALDDDPTLGGAVGFCVVQAVGEYGVRVIGDVSYYGANISVAAVI